MSTPTTAPANHHHRQNQYANIMHLQGPAATAAGAPRSLRPASPITSHHTTSLPTHAGGHVMGMAQGSMGSQTQTQTQTNTSDIDSPPVLRLRGAHEPGSRRNIHWAEDVVDNEGLGRKSSKVCCIYHAPKVVGESSSEDDSSSGSSSSDSDSAGDDDGAARMVGSSRRSAKRSRRSHGHEHNHDNGHEHGDDCGREGGGGSGSTGKKRPSPNAYEKMPKHNVRREQKR